MQERVESRERDKIILQHPFYQGEFYHQILMDATAFGEEAFTGTSAERRRLICIGLRGRFSGQVEGVAQPRGQLRKRKSLLILWSSCGLALMPPNPIGLRRSSLSCIAIAQESRKNDAQFGEISIP